MPYRGVRNLRALDDTALDSGDEAPVSGVEVEIEDGASAFGQPEGGIAIEENADGTVTIDFRPDQRAAAPGPGADEHDANLAEFIDLTELGRIGMEICEGVDSDIASRSEWNERLAKGLEVLGITIPSDADMGVLKVAKAIHHPLLAEALVQFQARAFAELFPPTGPAKSVVMGERTKETTEQAERVGDYLNYQLTMEDRPYYEESDQLLFMLGLEGSQFRKVFRDPLLERNVCRWVRAEHFVVPYSTTSLETAPRYTHILYESRNTVLKRMHAGYYVQEPLSPASANETVNQTVLQDAKDRAEGKEPEIREEDAEHVTYECHIDLDIKGFEDKGEDGESTGIALPYIVHVDKETQTVRAIRRNWKKDDQRKTKRIWFSHYKYLPGTGFYGFGLLHTIGGLSNAATALLRLICAGAGFAGMRGGFKTRSGRTGSDIEIEFGKYKEIDATYDELAKSFWEPNFKEPGESLFKVLGLIQELAQRFASTTESMVGDAKNTGPVGTTVALIEQGSKVATGIHKRNHIALGYELRMLAQLNGEYVPEEGYPYDVPGANRQILRSDFDEKVDVEPVSDPNIFSSTQRIALAQAGLEMANNAPDLYDRREAHRRMHQAMRTPDIDSLMPDKKRVQRCDPVTENSFAMVGIPIKVFPDQDDDAHIAVHMGGLQLAAARQSPALEMMQPALIAHVAEHEASKLRKQFSQQLGIALPPANFHAEGDEEYTQELPPQVEAMVAQKSAQIMQQLLAQLAQQQAQAQGAEQAGETQSAEEAHAAEQRRKDEAAVAEQRRKDAALHAQVDRDDAKAGLDPATVKSAQQYLAQRGLDGQVSARELAVVSRALRSSFDDVVRTLMFHRQGGQGGTFDQTKRLQRNVPG